MSTVRPIYGQSNLDLSIEGYGSLDQLVKMCNDNNISSINTPSKNIYNFDDNFISNINYTGYSYGTRFFGNSLPGGISYMEIGRSFMVR